MKSTLIAASVGVLMFSSVTSNAATISLARGLGNPGVIAAEDPRLGGTVLSGGGYYVAVGTFTNTTGVTEVPSITTDFSSLLAAVAAFDIFQFGTTPTSGATQGVMNLSLTSTGGPNPSVFNSKQIYVLVGNGSSAASSSQWGIFTTVNPVLFPADVTAAGTTAVALPTGAALSPLLNAGSVNGNNFRLVGIPEPSTMLLGALGALGLLRRRR